MVKLDPAHAIKVSYQNTKKTARKAVEGAAAIVEATESFKKIFQVAKGIIDLVGIFTVVSAFSPIVNASKVISITVGGFDIVGRIKEWVVPDKNGQTLIQKHWTKIISRIHLAFGNFIDTLKMLEFFNLFKIVKLDLLAAQMTKIYFFKVIFDHFPGLEVIKHPFIAFAASWSIFDSSLNIHRKRSDLKHIQHKKRNWEVLGNRSYERQMEFFERRIEKYDLRITDCKALLKAATKSKDKKRLNTELKMLQIKVPKYERLVSAMKADVNADYADEVQQFAADKASKWHQKFKNIKLDFAKASISIVCEVFKIFVVSLALALSLTLVGWTFLPSILVVLGLLSNASSLTKFLVDKVVPSHRVPQVKVLKLA